MQEDANEEVDKGTRRLVDNALTAWIAYDNLQNWVRLCMCALSVLLRLQCDIPDGKVCFNF